MLIHRPTTLVLSPCHNWGSVTPTHIPGPLSRVRSLPGHRPHSKAREEKPRACQPTAVSVLPYPSDTCRSWRFAARSSGLASNGLAFAVRPDNASYGRRCSRGVQQPWRRESAGFLSVKLLDPSRHLRRGRTPVPVRLRDQGSPGGRQIR